MKLLKKAFSGQLEQGWPGSYGQNRWRQQSGADNHDNPVRDWTDLRGERRDSPSPFLFPFYFTPGFITLSAHVLSHPSFPSPPLQNDPSLDQSLITERRRGNILPFLFLFPSCLYFISLLPLAFLFASFFLPCSLSVLDFSIPYHSHLPFPPPVTFFTLWPSLCLLSLRPLLYFFVVLAQQNAM